MLTVTQKWATNNFLNVFRGGLSFDCFKSPWGPKKTLNILFYFIYSFWRLFFEIKEGNLQIFKKKSVNFLRPLLFF